MSWQPISSPAYITLTIVLVIVSLVQMALYHQYCTRHLDGELLIRKKEKNSLIWNIVFSFLTIVLHFYFKITHTFFFLIFTFLFVRSLYSFLLNSKYKPTYICIQENRLLINSYFFRKYDLSTMTALGFDGLYNVLKIQFSKGKTVRIFTREIEKDDYQLLLKTIVSKAPESIKIDDNLKNILDNL